MKKQAFIVKSSTKKKLFSICEGNVKGVRYHSESSCRFWEKNSGVVKIANNFELEFDFNAFITDQKTIIFTTHQFIRMVIKIWNVSMIIPPYSEYIIKEGTILLMFVGVEESQTTISQNSSMGNLKSLKSKKCLRRSLNSEMMRNAVFI